MTFAPLEQDATARLLPCLSVCLLSGAAVVVQQSCIRSPIRAAELRFGVVMRSTHVQCFVTCCVFSYPALCGGCNRQCQQLVITAYRTHIRQQAMGRQAAFMSSVISRHWVT